MKTSTFEVGELVSTLSAAGVHRQIAMLSGVHHVDVNYVAGSATVHFDEAKTSHQEIRQRIIDCGYHCRGELVPAHVCEPTDHKMTEDAHTGHVAHGGSKGHAPKEMAPRSDPHAGHSVKLAQPMSEMTHDMGHAPGMSMQDMANDMRNRFFVALLFAIPVFLYSPMGKMFGDFATPFDLNRKVFLFIAATGAIAYPGCLSSSQLGVLRATGWSTWRP